MKIAALSLLSLFLFSSASHSPFDKEPFLTVQKTGCKGKCPVYIIKFFESGIIDLYGEKNISQQGHYQKTISLNEVEKIRKYVFKTGFFDLDNMLGSPSADHSPVYLSFKHAGQYKTITDYSSGNKEITKILEFIEQYLRQPGWKKM